MSVYISKSAARSAYVLRMYASFAGGYGFIKGSLLFFIYLCKDRLLPEGKLFDARAPDGGICSLRSRTSDFKVFTQVIAFSEYAIPGTESNGAIWCRYESIIRRGNCPIIIDAGANIGLSAYYFARKYPHAIVVGAEPDADNFAMAVTNTKSVLNVVLVQAAIWSKRTRLGAINTQAEHWSMSYKEHDGIDEGISALGIDDLIDNNTPENGELFIIKMDIEGAEDVVLRAEAKWKKRIPVLMIEPHDYLAPGQNRLGGLLVDSSYHSSDVFVRSDIICFVPKSSNVAGR